MIQLTLIFVSIFVQIDRCRPYFVCLLGERFGWCQQTEDRSDKLLDQSFDYAIKQDPKGLGWIEDHRVGTSVTKVKTIAFTS